MVIAIAGCEGGKLPPSYSPVPKIEALQGREVIGQFGCGKCHTIPGIRGAKGVVGPPLMEFGRRTYIAGNFPNQPQILTQWIMNPQAMKPKTAMPTWDYRTCRRKTQPHIWKICDRANRAAPAIPARAGTAATSYRICFSDTMHA